jgi:hypothetical protein
VDTGPAQSDYLDKARAVAVSVLIAAGLAAILGSFLDWVTITPPEILPQEEVANTQPFTGIEARDGWWIVCAGGLLIILATALLVRRRSFYAWLGFLTSLFIGTVAIADYRGIADIGSSISRRMNVVGDADPALGLILVAASALVGVVASLAGVAASPGAE